MHVLHVVRAGLDVQGPPGDGGVKKEVGVGADEDQSDLDAVSPGK